MKPTGFASPVILQQLKSLIIGDVKWTDEMISNWQPSMARLKELELFNFESESGVDASKLLSSCVELHSLSFSCGKGLVLTSPVALPHLKSLHLDLSELFHTENITVLERLLALNPQLEVIEIRDFSTPEMIRMVGRMVPNVAKLEVKLDWDVDEIGTGWRMFKNMKSLVTNCLYFAPTRILQAVADAAIPLEHLGVRSYDTDSGTTIYRTDRRIHRTMFEIQTFERIGFRIFRSFAISLHQANCAEIARAQKTLSRHERSSIHWDSRNHRMCAETTVADLHIIAFTLAR